MRKRYPQEDPSRRDFFRHAACAAVGATALVSTVWDLRYINAAAAARISSINPAATDYKALVCLFLYGGNDANNLVIPYDQPNYDLYAAARGLLALPRASLQNLTLNPPDPNNREYAFHPNCPELKALFDGGKLAIVANAGTLVYPVTKTQYTQKTVPLPPQLFSHNDQQVQWQTSVPNQDLRSGWGGRCADLLYSMNTNATVSMSISLSGVNVWEMGNIVNEYNVGTGGPQNLNIAASNQVQAFKDLINLQHANLQEKSAAGMTKLALDNYTAVTAALPPASSILTVFPTTSLGNQLKMVARLVKAAPALNHKRQIFFVAIGGFDLHDTQLTPHNNLLGDLSKCMKAFNDEMTAQGSASNVTSFTVSDFGRTFAMNGGNGSDHGWGNHQLVMGGAVNGSRVYGKFPILTVGGQDDTGLGRWIPTTSVDEYAATIAKWFGVSATDLNTVFPNLGHFANPDLGFLSAV
ncbi:MAG TPA: DUF1501 domain-containing protein [Tepidisphaeraceae bacterium]|jgi:uncharacterized protein (DUF1501 family)|nr:DUF1501 domain-containing protein [Tepidisphaeraceae bacterium]